MKKLFAILLSAMMMVSVAACSSDKDKENNPTPPDTAQEGTDSEETPADTEKATSESEDAEEVIPDAETSNVEEQTISGKITDATMNTVTIETEDGTSLSFSIPEEADKTEVDGMTIGDYLEITYTGTIEDEDTANAVIVKLVQTAAEAQ